MTVNDLPEPGELIRTIADRVRDRRHQLGLSQADLAERLWGRRDSSNVAHIEAGRHAGDAPKGMSAHNLLRLAAALETEPGWLMGMTNTTATERSQ